MIICLNQPPHPPIVTFTSLDAEYNLPPSSTTAVTFPVLAILILIEYSKIPPFGTVNTATVASGFASWNIATFEPDFALTVTGITAPFSAISLELLM